VKTIPLTQGKFALVDEADFEWLSQWTWHAHSRGYAARNSGLREGKRRKILMHREIVKPAEGLHTDHINGDRLDNRRVNLRVCTQAENNCNRLKRADNTSGFKGVYRHSDRNKPRPWVAKIHGNRRYVHVGCYATPEEAARAYDEAALKLHGEFAQLNFHTV